MRPSEETKTLTIGGMTCPGCELRIENALKKIPGIIRAEGKYTNGKVYITYDPSQTETAVIVKAVESLDYKVKHISDTEILPADAKATGVHASRLRISDKRKIAFGEKRYYTVPSLQKHKGIINAAQQKRKGIIIAVCVFAAVALTVFLTGNMIDLNARSLTQNAGYGVLFAVGLVTSLHCLFMCGSINLAVCTSYQANHKEKPSKIKPSILYNAGRVVTCTAVGGIVGGIGSVIALAPGVGGAVTVAAGVFMVLMGITMLNLFPGLRKIMPRMPKFLGSKVYGKIGKSGPFVVGMLNGFMPCGALQSMQIYALGTGSMFTGALSMFFFSLGTVPLMFGFGALSSALSERFTKIMTKIGAVMIMVMGLIMLVRGMAG